MGAPRGTLAERFWRKVPVHSSAIPCWEWTGYVAPNGYGKMYAGPGRNEWAHRVAWQLFHGWLPKRPLTIDHLCHNRRCVNPHHMEVVTAAENTLRGNSAAMVAHREGRCVRGHPQAESYLRKGTNHVVYCRTCRRERHARS